MGQGKAWKNAEDPFFPRYVIPAEAGIQGVGNCALRAQAMEALDSRLRGNDE
jgi:hypothetical protein